MGLLAHDFRVECETVEIQPTEEGLDTRVAIRLQTLRDRERHRSVFIEEDDVSPVGRRPLRPWQEARSGEGELAGLGSDVDQ